MPLPRLLALSNLDKWHLLQFLGSPSWKCWEWQLSAAKESLHPEPGMAVGKPGQYNCDESHAALGPSRVLGQISSLRSPYGSGCWFSFLTGLILSPLGTGRLIFPFSVSSHLLSSIGVAKLLAPAGDARCLRLVCLILGNDSNKGTFSSPPLNSLAPPSGAFSTSTSTSPHFFLRSSSQ